MAQAAPRGGATALKQRPRTAWSCVQSGMLEDLEERESSLLFSLQGLANLEDERQRHGEEDARRRRKEMEAARRRSEERARREVTEKGPTSFARFLCRCVAHNVRPVGASHAPGNIHHRDAVIA